MTKNESLVIERVVRAPVARVWQALTDIDELKQWCPFFNDFKPRVGYHTEFMLGPDAEHQYLHHVEVLEVVPDKKLAYSWDYGGMSPDSTVEFELYAQGDTTRIVLICKIDPLPADPPDFMKGTSAGWNYTLSELSKFVEHTPSA